MDSRKRPAKPPVIHADKAGMLRFLDRHIAEHERERRQCAGRAGERELAEHTRAEYRTRGTFQSGITEGLTMARGWIAGWAEADQIRGGEA